MKNSQLINNLLSSEIDPAYAKRSALILETIAQKKPRRVLDAGCGRGFYVNALTLFDFPKEIHGIDINEKYLNRAKKSIADKRVTLQKGSLYKLPYPDDYFDAVICSEVLEHLNDDKKAILEISRVLKKGGTLLVTVPNANFPFFWDPLNWILMKFFNTHINKNIWWLAGIWADHERLYSEQEITLLLNTKYKILNTKLVLHWCWPFSHFLLYGIGKNIVERIGVSEFDRFSKKSDKKLSKLIALIMRLPTLIRASTNDPSVNIFISCEK